MNARKLVTLLGSAALIGAMSVSFAAAQDDTVIRIASQSPLSGGQSALGISIRNAVELAINQLSGPLVDMGYTVEFVPFDDQATADVGVSNAQTIVADPSILGVVGHLNSGVALPSSEVYKDYDLVMVSPANTNPAITDRGYPSVNRVVGRDDLQAPFAARFADEVLGVESVYVIHDTTPYGQGVAEYFQIQAAESGLIELGFEGTTEMANFESILQPILALEPDLVFFAGIYNQAAVFINQARAAGYEGQFMGTDGFDSGEFAAIAGEAGVGTYYTTVAGPASAYPAAAQFIEDYTAAFGEAPQPYAAQSYDSTAIIINAIISAAEAAGGVPTRADVAAAVRATTDFQGLTNPVTFDANGDPEFAFYYVLQVASANGDEWSSNTVAGEPLELPSPLHAAEMAAMEMTPEATPGS